jgi:Tetratricopeptide repeat
LKFLYKYCRVFLLICFGLIASQQMHAQNKTPKEIADSTRNAMREEKRVRDSTIAANKERILLETEERHRKADSTKIARQQFRDSVTDARESLRKEREAIAKKKNSKKYIKEQEKIKQNRIDSIAYARQTKSDSIKKERKTRFDELAKQRESKIESLVKNRKETADSIATARKEATAKTKEIRKKYTDSISKVRQVRKDSIALAKNKRLQQLKKLYKTAEEIQAELAMKKHKENQANFSNQNFLKKPWTLPRKLYQNTVTHYNYYYNAKKIYTESLEGIQKNTNDDFSQQLNIESILQTGNTKAGGGNMDSVVKKCALGIQIHDPRAKWFDDLYLLMGKAYLLKGETDQAIATFQYIGNEYKEKPKKPTGTANKKKIVDTAEKYSIATIENRKSWRVFKHQPVRNDALLYLAKAYLQAGAYSDAQTLIGILDLDPHYPKRLKAEADLLNAQLYLATNSTDQAIVALNNSLKNKTFNKVTNQKVTYLLAQLLAKQGEYDKSNKEFSKVITMHPNVDMDFYAKLNIAKNTAQMPNADIADVEKMLKQLINDGKYEKYLDKSYLALGIIQSTIKPELAIENLNQAIAKAKQNKMTKEEAYAVLGELFFNKQSYKQSKVAYDSCLFYVADATSAKNIDIENRRNLLKDLVKELTIIEYNDSLIALSKLTKKEQIAIAKKAMKADKKAKNKKDENDTPQNVDNEPSSTNSSSWYFSNSANVLAGKSKFELKWGNRPNTDNWRRLAAISAATLTKQEEQNNESTENEVAEENTEEKKGIDKYLSEVPNTEEKLNLCNASRENALYNASVIFYAGLSDDKKTIEFLETLLKDFPNTDYKSKAYYALYLANLRLQYKSEADKYLALLNNDFPEDELVKLATNKGKDIAQENNQKEVLAYYSATYDMYKDNKFSEVLPRVSFARSNYKEHPLIAKFDLLEAMTTTSLKKYDDARKQLTKLITSYAGNEEATFAQDILALLNQKDTVGVDSSNVLNKIAPSFSSSNTVTKFAYEPNQPHYFMIVLHSIDDRISPLKSGFGDFNAIKHSTDNLESSLYLIDQDNGAIIFKQFANEKLARKYLKEVEDNKKLYSVYKSSEYELTIISENNYTYFKTTRNLEGYLKFYKSAYK